jgi:hypothetical protein
MLLKERGRMNLFELKTGWIVQTRNKKHHLVFFVDNNPIPYLIDKDGYLNAYNMDLSNKITSALDIVKVFEPVFPLASCMAAILLDINWAVKEYYKEFVPPKPKLTLPQIKAILRYDFDLIDQG